MHANWAIIPNTELVPSHYSMQFLMNTFKGFYIIGLKLVMQIFFTFITHLIYAVDYILYLIDKSEQRYLRSLPSHPCKRRTEMTTDNHQTLTAFISCFCGSSGNHGKENSPVASETVVLPCLFICLGFSNK